MNTKLLFVILSHAILQLAMLSRCVAADTDTAQLKRYAKATWASVEKMVQENGLPSDGLEQLDDGSWRQREWTSPSNIACYFWSVLSAERLHIISSAEAKQLVTTTLSTLRGMKNVDGLYYNWYDPESGEVLYAWPRHEAPIRPILSSIDNAWLEMGLRAIAQRFPELRDICEELISRIDYRRFLSESSGVECGFHISLDPQAGALSSTRYNLLNSETRIIAYLAICKEQVPAQFYEKLWRQLPAESNEHTRVTTRGVCVS